MRMPARIAASAFFGANGRPSRSMVPSSGAWFPHRSLTSVDLPAPFCPTRTWTSLRRMARSTPSSARTPGKRFRTPRSSMMVSSATAGLQVLGRDELHRRLLPTLDLLALLHGEAGLDAVRRHVGAELVDRGQHLPVLDELLDRRDVVE